MSVRLIAVTQPSKEFLKELPPELHTPEGIMAYCARVSSEYQANPDYAKLLKYCIKNAHWSVFEHAFATIEIETSRTIARQILRHRSFCFQEFSQRYQSVSDEFIMNKARAQDHKNRQSSHDTLPEHVKESFEANQRMIWGNAMGAYKYMLDLGVAKECARALLPEGLTPSKMYMSGNIRNWIHYIQLRTGNGTQLEHREIAEEIKKLLVEAFPTVALALEWEIEELDKTP